MDGINIPCYDYIYGKKVLISSRAQINPHPWSGDPRLNHIITRNLRKEVDFFITLCKLREGPFCIIKQSANEQNIPPNIGTSQDDVVTGDRVLVWTKVAANRIEIQKTQSSGTGHNKNGAHLKKETFCAKDPLIALA